MKGNLAFALPEKLSKKILKLQKQLNLKTPGDVIMKALSLLELSMGRNIELKDEKETLEIKSLKGYRQSIKVESIPEKEDKED